MTRVLIHPNLPSFCLAPSILSWSQHWRFLWKAAQKVSAVCVYQKWHQQLRKYISATREDATELSSKRPSSMWRIWHLQVFPPLTIQSLVWVCTSNCCGWSMVVWQVSSGVFAGYVMWQKIFVCMCFWWESMIIIVSSMDCCIQSKKLSLWLAAPKMSFRSSSHPLKFKDSVIWSRLIRHAPEDR